MLCRSHLVVTPIRLARKLLFRSFARAEILDSQLCRCSVQVAHTLMNLNLVGRASPATNARLTVESEIMMKLQVRKIVVLGIVAALFVSAAPTADAGLFGKLFKCCKKDEEPACSLPSTRTRVLPSTRARVLPSEPEPASLLNPPAPEPVCCRASTQNLFLVVNQHQPAPVCCEPGTRTSSVHSEPTARFAWDSADPHPNHAVLRAIAPKHRS